MAAMTAGRSKKSASGGYYRRLKARIGGPKAITATARKIAGLFYNMLKHGEEYVEKELAKSLDFDLVKNAHLSINKI